MRTLRVVLAVAVITAVAFLSACIPGPGDLFGGGGGGSPATVSAKGEQVFGPSETLLEFRLEDPAELPIATQ